MASEDLSPEEAEKKIPSMLFKGSGCSACNNTGYKGRIAIFEIMNVDEEMRDLISNKQATIDKIRELNRKKGMLSMFEDGLRKASLGITTLEEVLRVIKQ